MKRFNNILATIILAASLAGVSLPVSAAGITLRAKLDSATLLMGNTTALHLELVQDANVNGAFSVDRTDTLNSFVEIAARIKPDTVSLGNTRRQINRDIIIQSFDSGVYVLPPILYFAGRDTIESNPLTLKVIPVKVDSLKDIHDFKPVHEIPFRLFDLLPSWITDYWWISLLLMLLLAAATYAYLRWFRKGENPFKPKEVILPPYDEAMKRLQELKGQNLWQNGQEKEYYTVLTDILRNYIDRRFGINAVEMTSTQIIDTLRKNEETRAVNEQLKEILSIADFVKFANMRPLADDNETSFQRAVRFVEDTKPVEVEPETEPDEADNQEEEVKP
ncbi:MAG: cell wall anchor protein [Muribaculaceae bacterium]|nr:cell wall anchor protein [Muribaculaceae bacterium]